MSPTFSLVINAGGQSRRMGQDKALLPVPTSGQPLLYHIIQRLRHLPIQHLIVVSNDLTVAIFERPVTFVPDVYPGAGPLGGIATGLQLCSEWGIFVACDMPLVNPHVFQFLCELASEQHVEGGDRWEAVVPHIDEFAEDVTLVSRLTHVHGQRPLAVLLR